MVVRDWLSNALNDFMNCKKIRKTETVICPVSNLMLRVFEIMKQHGYLEDVKVEQNKFRKAIIKLGKLNYCKAIKPRFVVKKGQYEKYIRRYLPARQLGIIIVSTDKGLMTHREAMEKGLGGVLIAYCY